MIRNKGFTLIEISIVTTIIVVILAIVIIAISPGQRLANARDDRRQTDLDFIYQIIEESIFYHKGSLPIIISEDFQEICNTPRAASCDGFIDLSEIYSGDIPMDPQKPVTDNGTGYELTMKNGKILLASSKSERRIIIKGMEEKTVTGGLMDYTIWEDGQTGSVSPFTAWSTGNSRTMAVDPWGKETVVWMSGERNPPTETYPAQGGIYYNAFPIDNTKMYRMSWWEKRVTNADATYARYYAGLNGYGSTDGVLLRDTGANNTNPYFHVEVNMPSAPAMPVGEWVLVVGHVWPAGFGTGANHADSGIWNLSGEKISNLYYRDYVWRAETTTARSRTLAIYQGNSPDVVHHTVYPRIDIIDGTEPSIQDLLNGFDSKFNI